MQPPSQTSIRLMYLRGLFHSVTTLFKNSEKTFSFDDQIYKYFFHPYNLTWMNERCVEVPLGMAEIQKHEGSNILEIGNVISHYVPASNHTVIDRYEKGNPRVLNIDAREYQPGTRYDLIVSLSTFEHVGWDEDPRTPDKSWETILHLRSLLAPGGKLFFTVPAGYHPPLDRALRANAEDLGPLKAMKRTSAANHWIQCSPDEAAACEFGRPYPFANAITIASASAD